MAMASSPKCPRMGLRSHAGPSSSWSHRNMVMSSSSRLRPRPRLVVVLFFFGGDLALEVVYVGEVGSAAPRVELPRPEGNPVVGVSAYADLPRSGGKTARRRRISSRRSRPSRGTGGRHAPRVVPAPEASLRPPWSDGSPIAAARSTRTYRPTRAFLPERAASLRSFFVFGTPTFLPHGVGVWLLWDFANGGRGNGRLQRPFKRLRRHLAFNGVPVRASARTLAGRGTPPYKGCDAPPEVIPRKTKRCAVRSGPVRDRADIFRVHAASPSKPGAYLGQVCVSATARSLRRPEVGQTHSGHGGHKRSLNVRLRRAAGDALKPRPPECCGHPVPPVTDIDFQQTEIAPPFLLCIPTVTMPSRRQPLPPIEERPSSLLDAHLLGAPTGPNLDVQDCSVNCAVQYSQTFRPIGVHLPTLCGPFIHCCCPHIWTGLGQLLEMLCREVVDTSSGEESNETSRLMVAAASLIHEHNDIQMPVYMGSTKGSLANLKRNRVGGHNWLYED
ncbi:hypothetical protein QYE76_059690 [Lolium multiflorum]|uniref:Uncharacterized protein n=1 Tax=Lolium multiflorum TaxID=4521 RepID=A0AAD8W4P4_LOLMU|nr:hypothetical protein QYE76_059690 [Lolium multiflorum]